jgi:hypothetical protein
MLDAGAADHRFMNRLLQCIEELFRSIVNYSSVADERWWIPAFAGVTIVRRTKIARDLDGFGEFLTIGGAQAGGGHRKQRDQFDGSDAAPA